MLENDPRQAGLVLHGVAKTKPKRVHKRTLQLDGALFTCDVRDSSCAEHSHHKESGRIVRKGQEDVAYHVVWSYELPLTIRGSNHAK